MKYCANCGEPLSDEAVFCPICGKKAAPAEAEPVREAEPAPEAAAEANAPEANENTAAPGKKKKGGKAGLIIALVAVGLIALLLIAGALMYFTGAYTKLLPASRLKLGIAEKAYVDDALDEFFENYNKSVDKAKGFELKADLDITADLELSDDASVFSQAMIINSLLEKAALKVKLDINEEHSNMLLEASYSNNPIVDARVIRTEDLFGIYVPLLDDKYYTASPETLTQLIGELSEEYGEGLTDELPAVSADQLKVQTLDEQKLRAEIMDLLKIVGKLSTKENTVIERGVTRSIAGKFDEKGDLYTITPSEEEFEAVFNEAADYLAKDGCYISELVNNIAANYKTDDQEEDFVLAEYIRKTAQENARDLAEKNTKIVVFMVGTEILSQSMVNDDGSFVYDEVTRDKVEYRRVLVNSKEDGGAEVLLENNIADKNKLSGKLTADLTVTDPLSLGGFKGGKFVLDYNFDKTKTSSIKTYPGTAVLSFRGEELASLTVTPVGDNMKHTLILDLEKINGVVDEIDDLEVSRITLIALASEGTGVEAPTGVEPTDLADYSADEITEIVSDMLEKLSTQLIRILT